MRRSRSIPLGDPFLFALVVGLSLFGIAMVFSAGVLDVPNSIVRGLWRTQLLWFCLGMIALPFVLKVPVIWLEWAAQPLYALAIVLLVLTIFIGTGAGTAASVSGWLAVGPIRIQPSEFAKIAVILMLARVLGSWREAPRTLWALWKPIAIVMVPMALVMKQPDLGTALVFGSILLAMLFWAGTPLPTIFFLISPVVGLFLSINPWLWGAYIVLLGLAMAFLYKPYLSEGVTIMLVNIVAGTVALPLWNSLQQYQKNRFLVFLDPNIDARGAGYNLIQSRVAIGSGGLFGKGFLEGSQKRLAFLPEQHTDFIFAVFGEEFGFLGNLLLLLLFTLIISRGVVIAAQAQTTFNRLLAGSITLTFFTYVFVNIGMVSGILPVVGVPLPLISYGGTSLVTILLCFGILMSIHTHKKLVTT